MYTLAKRTITIARVAALAAANRQDKRQYWKIIAISDCINKTNKMQIDQTKDNDVVMLLY